MAQTVKPYEQCATRLEQRGWHPPSRAFVDGLVAALKTTGVEAVIHSAVSQACVPLFPSRVFPSSHPEASQEAFTYLIESLHHIGRPVLSWYSLNHSDSVAQAHPDWRMKPITGPGLRPRREADPDHYVCINSPYQDLLPAFCAEIVRDVGFDGIWFDGSTFAMDGNSLPGCVCQWCRKGFQDDTGQALPDTVDWDSPVFRAWVNWRYDRLMSLWRRTLDAVHAVKPEATVCFNNYRRRREDGAWTTGIPLHKLGWDAVMSGELDLNVFHGDFQMKMHHAYGCRRGQDSWMALCDHWNCWVPDVDLLPIQQAAVACASAGGVMWMGSGTDPALVPETCATAQETAAPLMPYVGGETVEYAAIWASQQTQDFYGKTDSMGGWDAWHGANELCLHAHAQSSIVFDDHVTDGDIVGKSPVLIAGNAACVSAAQAQQLRRYVTEGGILIACHDAGVLDELGHPWPTPVLDELLGITSRRHGEGTGTLELLDPELTRACGKWVSVKGPHTLAEPGDRAEVLAHVVDHGAGSWDNRETRKPPPPRHPGLWTVRHGKGAAVYLGANLFPAHIHAPTTFLVRLFRTLLFRLAPPALTVECPMQVTSNTRVRDDGSWIVHLHNAPGSIWRYGSCFNSGELVPIHDVRLVVNGRHVCAARSGLTGAVFELGPRGRTVTVPVLRRNEVVVLRFEGPEA